MTNQSQKRQIERDGANMARRLERAGEGSLIDPPVYRAADYAECPKHRRWIRMHGKTRRCPECPR
jgi:hypothetical protein